MNLIPEPTASITCNHATLDALSVAKEFIVQDVQEKINRQTISTLG